MLTLFPSPWTPFTIQLDADQAKILVTGFSDPGAVAASGIRIGDKKFISIGGIPGECLRGRKGAGGCTVKKTNTAMVIGIYDEGVQGGDCNVIVENLGDYLIGQNI
uniref:Profilin n=1 Tax=Chloropicon primus TaxID=1764295 RepID=A0A7S2X131_9CHLO|mmetsp:Transcript_5005/g.14970  ORF Transcript_5005/g.14970 Transcript_5005/m.14970 type:complete len:106 (+) Transcript_5005:399-716(+)